MIPNISSWWRRNENSSFRGPAGSTLDLQKIEQRVDGLEYGAVTEFIADMQQMLKSVVQHFSYRHEVAAALHQAFYLCCICFVFFFLPVMLDLEQNINVLHPTK
jgi:hypothetical protein